MWPTWPRPLTVACSYGCSVVWKCDHTRTFTTWDWGEVVEDCELWAWEKKLTHKRKHIGDHAGLYLQIKRSITRNIKRGESISALLCKPCGPMNCSDLQAFKTTQHTLTQNQILGRMSKLLISIQWNWMVIYTVSSCKHHHNNSLYQGSATYGTRKDNYWHVTGVYVF